MNKLRFILAIAVVVLVATSAIALAGQRAPAHAQNHARTHMGQAAHPRPGARRTAEQHAVDTDNVQQGDQTTPDTANSRASEEANTPEAPSSDTEQGQAGEPSSGHQDPPGDVNHECGGNCQE